VRTVDEVLPDAAVARLAAYKRAVVHAVPGIEKLILFGSRARGQASDESDYDVAIVLRNPSDRRHFRRILSDLAYEHVLDGFFIRPVLLPLEDFEPHGRRLTELAEDIIRDGIEIA